MSRVLTKTEGVISDTVNTTVATQRSHSVSQRGLRARRVIDVLIVLLVAFAFGRMFGAELIHVRSESMAPTLEDGQRVIAEKISYHVREPRVGEVILVRIQGALSVKRIVGVGGDIIEIYDGVLRRNGEDIVESYINNDGMGGHFFGPVTIPEGELFVLGDHRLVSSDSRSFGPVPVSQVRGRLISGV